MCSVSLIAGVAQLVERDVANVEAVGSNPTSCSTSGVSSHSASSRLGESLRRCAQAFGRAYVQRSTTSDGMLAFGHSRSGNMPS